MSVDSILSEAMGRWRAKSMNLTTAAEDNEATASRMAGVPQIMLAPQGAVHDRNAADVDAISEQVLDPEDLRHRQVLEDARRRREAIDPFGRMGRSGPAMELGAPYLAAAAEQRRAAAWLNKKIEFAKEGVYLSDPQRAEDPEDVGVLAAASRGGRVVARPGWFAELANQLGYPLAVGR